MERPSHIGLIVPDIHPKARRAALVALAVSLQALIIWGFATGLSVSSFHFIPSDLAVKFTPTDEPHSVPPPAPPLQRPGTPKLEKPIFETATPQPDRGAITVRGSAGASVTDTAPSTGPSRAAMTIASTHTAPPYPPVARRLGEEGTVMLRLTVLATGKVGRADIVQSSGHERLDEAARQWVVAHWTYRPAVEGGQPAVSQTLAQVQFSLKDGR